MIFSYRKKVSTLLFLSTAGLIVFFQNCSNKNFTTDVTSTSVANNLSTNISLDCSVGGETIAENDSKMFFLNSTVPYGSTCQYENRVCTKGYFTGSYQYSTCEVGVAASCLFNGATIPHGGSIFAFSNSTVAYGQSCSGQTRTCNNGVLSGSNQFSSCGVGQAAACLFNGTNVAHGASVTAFAASTTPFGTTCQSQTRTCNNGILSGSNTFSTCNVGAPASCTFNNLPVAHGQTVVAYSRPTRATFISCSTFRQTRICYNGLLSGSYTYSSCH